jgi:hypothetical protein
VSATTLVDAVTANPAGFDELTAAFERLGRAYPATDTTHVVEPTPDIVIALAGRAGTGKDTAADYLEQHYGFARAAFAEPLKEMIEQLLTEAGLDHAWLHEPRLKNIVIPELGVSARQMMQTLGDWGRNMHPDWWVRLLARRMGLVGGAAHAPVHDRIVITDLRFGNEADWLRSVGGRVIRLHREQAPSVHQHISEAQVATLRADVDLMNHGPTHTGLHTLLDGAMADMGIERWAGLWEQLRERAHRHQLVRQHLQPVDGLHQRQPRLRPLLR